MISFAGETSKEHYLIVEHYPRRRFPAKREELQTVPGRSEGVVVYEGDGDVFEEYDQQYQVFLDAKNPGLSIVAREIAEWLLSPVGYQRLEDSYDPDFYRMARYTGGEEFSNYFNEYGRGTITFKCAPERYYKNGEEKIQVTNGQKLYGPSKFKAKPKLYITGSGNVSISLAYDSGRTNTFTINGVNGTVEVDPVRHTAIQNGTNINSSVLGKYEDLRLEKVTTISYSNGITKLELIPRWWTI